MNIPKSLFILTLCLFCDMLFAQFCNMLLAQGESHPNFLKPSAEAMLLQKTTAKDSLIIWQEQIELHLDKVVTSPKDHIFFKAYVLTGLNQNRTSMSDVLKIELLDKSGKLVKNQYHKIEDGVSQGSIEIPKKTDEGKYYVRAYTRWMMNYGPSQFAVKKIDISDSRKLEAMNKEWGTHIQFFPEGGELVAGLQNKLAIKGFIGQPANLMVSDAQDNRVSAVTSYGDNLAMTTFTPEKGRDYFLSTEDGQKYPLPKAKDQGVTLLVNNIDALNAQVRIEVSPELQNEQLNLKGMAKGVTYFQSELDLKAKPLVELEIPKADIPKGILTLTVFDEFDQVWAERPIYIQNDELKITIEPHDNNVFKVKVTDREDKPVETALSLGVNRFNQIEHKKGMADSQTAGKNLRGQRFANDLFLLTGQGSDGLNQQSVIEMPSEIYYDFQKGLDFYGQAYDLNNSLLSDTKIQIFLSTEDDNAMAVEAITDVDGMFKLSGIQFEGEGGMVFRTKADDVKGKLVKVVPYDFEAPPMFKNLDLKAPYFSKKTPFSTNDDLVKGDEKKRLIALEEVTLKEEKIRKRAMPPVYGIKARQGRMVIQDPERPRSIFELLLGIPGINISGNVNSPTVNILSSEARAGTRSNTGGSTLDQPGPLWVIDGFVIENSFGFSPGWGITANDIDRIEYIAPYNPDISIWGSRAGIYGAFLVYTRNGSELDYLNRKEAQLIYHGFHKSIDFETYLDGLSAREKENYEVLYWNPSLTTDENGEALVKFDNQQKVDKLKIEATAITQEGQVGKTTKYLNVK